MNQYLKETEMGMPGVKDMAHKKITAASLPQMHILHTLLIGDKITEPRHDCHGYQRGRIIVARNSKNAMVLLFQLPLGNHQSTTSHDPGRATEAVQFS